MTRINRLESTQSTNADAMHLGQAGEAGPLWVVAREQVGGRGRHGRAWHSPPGNLYASLLLVNACTPDIAPQLGFVTSVALAEAIDAMVAHSTDVSLKWPNDLLHHDAKFVGILLEAARRADGAFLCVAGIGVNCRSNPGDLPYRATNLSEITGRNILPDDLLPHLDEAMTSWLARWDAGRAFSTVRDAWLARAAGVGEPVDVTLQDRVVTGIFRTIDHSGRMLVETETGNLTIDAGDVRIGPRRAGSDMANT